MSHGAATVSLYDRLHRLAKRIDIDGRTYWRIEGDTLLDEDQLRQYAEQRDAMEAERAEAGQPLVATVELLGTKAGNRIVRWEPGLELSYCVLRKTFEIGGEAGYSLVTECLRQATADWEATCGVKFTYQPGLNDSDSMQPEGPLFVVREFNAHGQFIAAAFFPTDPVDRRRVLIDPSFYSPKLRFAKVGVLRHELGHVLGFRHEQIRSEAPPGCPDEDTYGTINLGAYDPHSVMHYFCGGVGSETLAITELDRIGSQRVYGPPLSDFRFVS